MQKHSPKCAALVEGQSSINEEQPTSSTSTARRLLCLSETCLIERDPASYSVICARLLRTVCAKKLSNYTKTEFTDCLLGSGFTGSTEIQHCL